METDDPQEGLDTAFCFMDDQRICNGSCMAYITFPNKGPELNEQQNRCGLLVFAERASRHLVVLAKIASDMNTTTKKTIADKKREASIPSVPTASPFPKPPEGL